MARFLKILMVAVIFASSACSKKEEMTEEMTIYTKSGEVVYNVENAITPEQLEKGLMYRDSMPEDYGMMFDLSSAGFVAMWMKNTKIPLDFVFIDENGTVAWIYENAVPYSEENIVPPMPVVAVVELNAGEVKKHGIEVDDVIKHSFFDEQNPNKINSNKVKFEDVVVIDENTTVTTEFNDEYDDEIEDSEEINAVEPDTGVIIIDDNLEEEEIIQ